MNTTGQQLKQNSQVELKKLFLDNYLPHFNASQFTHIESLPSLLSGVVRAKPSAPGSIIDTFFRNKFLGTFKHLEYGKITLTDPLETVVVGDEKSDMHCEITVGDISAYSQMVLNGANGCAQAYIDGQWTTGNLTELIRIFVRNRSLMKKMDSGLARLAQLIYRRWHATNRNTRSGSKRNIAAHYDLGNEFFRLFLDQRMMYSSALYKHGDDLQTAADRKLQRICEALELGPEDNVIEIGSGWGGFACYAAQTMGCRVTTVTISNEQYEEASRKVKDAGLENLVTVKLQDYRDIEGVYDKLVSIEMIEAIGHQYLNTYFNKINTLLNVNGKALVQAIVIDDAEYERALKRVDYIKRYIFPGGFMPCYSVIGRHAAKNRLMLEDLHDMGLSYAQTLRDWRRKFYQNIDKVDDTVYDKAFQRMWEFYLCYCEGAFDERAISVGQILFRKQASLG